ncbi:hypothetical protein ACFWYW_47030 [Nonomuraea sp. NPDC059023]|uniref:hypothetical protein n=1 Tax=unclassified Nonomuraea TaxID=2593643 RepID=UPI0036C04532
MYVIVAELNDGEQSHGVTVFGPDPDGKISAEEAVEQVYAWAASKGYKRGSGEVNVSACRVFPLAEAAERSAVSRFAAIPVGDKDGLRALAHAHK